MCKEPIVNHICIDCLGRDINSWLPAYFSGKFLSFHDNFSGHFRIKSSGMLFCLKCRSFSDKTVCSYCYTNEAFSFFRTVDEKLARAFSTLFPYVRYGVMYREFSLMGGVEPITEEYPEERNYGVCDLCEESSYDLVESNGEMLCENCRNER